MLRRELRGLLLSSFIFSVALIMAGCGSNPSASTPASSGSTSSVPPAMGSVVVFGQDAPVCDVVSFTVTVSGATLTPQGGGTAVSVLSTPVTVDFVRLVDFATVLNFSSVPVATYSQITLTLSNPQLSVLDVTQNPPQAVNITTTLTASTVTVNINPTLVVTATGSAGLGVDFDLHKSVQVDANGQVTGTVNPTFTVLPVSANTAGELEEIDDLAGLVQSVSTTANGSFAGSFTLLTEDGTTVTVNATSSTEFDDSAGLSNLSVGTFIEANSFVDTNGNVVATEVEAEDEEDENDHRSAFIGIIASVTRDTSGNATQFVVFTRGELPDEANIVPHKSMLTVNVSGSTRFKLDARGVNQAGLTFNAASLGMGQEVVVHGKVRDNSTPAAVDARAVFLKLQSIRGNFVSLLGSQSDNKTGGFTFTSCAAVFQGQTINVFSFSTTGFENVAGLSALTPQPTVVIRGLLFYQPQAVTINGLAVTAPALVFEAKQVHQLND